MSYARHREVRPHRPSLWIRPHHCLPLALCDFVDAESERFRQYDRNGVVPLTHHEFARRNKTELHADRVRRLDGDAEVLRPRFLMGFGLCFVERSDGGWRGVTRGTVRRPHPLRPHDLPVVTVAG